MRKSICGMLAVLWVTTASAVPDENPALSALFSQAQVKGTLVIADGNGEVTAVVDPARATTRFIPASTFKIANALIALETGAAHGADQPFHWDGVVRPVAAWNQNQTLKSAMQVSCVWCFQQLARTIGPAGYAQWLPRLNYGNAAYTPEVDRFWLDGDLRISAVEQIDFLHRLYRRALPVNPAHIATVLDITTIEDRDGKRLYAKTGWATRREGDLGWYVGVVAPAADQDGKASDVHFFALNIDMPGAESLPLRSQLVRTALATLNIFHHSPTP